MGRITSINELARYKVGEIAYIVNMRALVQSQVRIEPQDSWVCDHHPKVLFERKFYKSWKSRDKLPKLPADIFQCWTTLLTSEFIVEQFQIKGVNRSLDTGEFYYMRDGDELIMPESCLLDSSTAAHRERERIIKIIQKWAKP